MRAILANLGLLSTAMLSACAAVNASNTAPSAGQWVINRQIDRISGQPAPKVFLEAAATNSRTRKKGASIIQLMCFEKQPVVRFAYDFRVGAQTNSVLEYRFDQNPGHKATSKILNDYKTIMIQDRTAVQQFVDELANANVLFVRVTSLQEGRTEAEYHPPGASVAIEAAYGECPLAPPEPTSPKA